MMRSLQAQTQPLKGSRTVPLRLVLILPFVLQISVAVGLTGWLSIQNGRKAISDLTGQLRSEVAMRIQQHLNQYLEKPYLVTQSNADASQLGHLHFDDVSAVERHFWRQKQLFGSVGAIYFGSTSGISVTVDRNQQDGFVSSVTEKFPRLGSYRLDNQGDRVEQVKVYPEYDPRTRPWYQAAVAAQKPVWSEVYPFLEGELGITQSQPFYDPAGRFQGVVAVDLFLSGFSNFLESLKISPTAKMLIVDRSGYLVATSVADQPLSISQGNDDAQLVQAIASRDPLIQATIQHLFDRYGSLEPITEAQQLDFSWNGQREFVQVLPYQQSGLDWLVVAVIPEADFMAQINTNTRTTILLCCAALAIATLLGLLTSKWITQPILRLSQASETLATTAQSGFTTKDNHAISVASVSRVRELGVLSDSFQHMAQQLHNTFVALEATNAQLEHRVEERTAQLKAAKEAVEEAFRELQLAQTQMIQAEKMSSLGQLVAGVAHEINNPVNFIFGNLNHLEQYAQDLTNLLETYQSNYPDPVGAVQAQAAAIDVDYLVEDLPKLLRSMRIGSQRIQEIVLALRIFSRLDEAQVKAVNLHEGLDSTLLILGHRLKATAHRVAIAVIRQYGELPQVECYAGQLNQVLMNVLANAIDAIDAAIAQQPQLLPSITIATAVIDAAQVEIRITDNGIGIPESVRQRIFDPFFTTKAVGVGTGMGLAISYQIVVERHGGSFSCRSQPGQGTEFVIQIPLKQSRGNCQISPPKLRVEASLG